MARWRVEAAALSERMVGPWQAQDAYPAGGRRREPPWARQPPSTLGSTRRSLPHFRRATPSLSAPARPRSPHRGRLSGVPRRSTWPRCTRSASAWQNPRRRTSVLVGNVPSRALGLEAACASQPADGAACGTPCLASLAGSASPVRAGAGCHWLTPRITPGPVARGRSLGAVDQQKDHRAAAKSPMVLSRFGAEPGKRPRVTRAGAATPMRGRRWPSHGVEPLPRRP